jgi:hypothetical protein
MAQALEIAALLTNIIPHNKWVLVIIGDHEVLKYECNHPHIKTYYLQTNDFSPPLWNTTSILWSTLFKLPFFSIR